jgi:hypothetical protein
MDAYRAALDVSAPKRDTRQPASLGKMCAVCRRLIKQA